MNTNDLIDMLARNAGPAPAYPALQRFAWALAIGITVALGGTVASLGVIPATMFELPAPWIKLTYGLLLLVLSCWMVVQLGRPAAPFMRQARALRLVLFTMLGLGLISLLAAPSGFRLAAITGHSWFICPVAILALSVPALVSSFWAMKGLAPTQLRLAGFACGLFAGAAGAVGYSLGCTETSTTFIAIWYSLGVLAVGGVGALLGPVLLRW